MTQRNRAYVRGESAAKGYVQDINLSHTFEQIGHDANVRKQKEEIAVSVVLVIVRRGVIAGGPHSSAVGLSLKTLCSFPFGRYTHEVAPCGENLLGVTMITGDHVTAAVSCCLACGPGRPVVVLFRSLGHKILILCCLLRPETDCKRMEQQWTRPNA